MEQCDRCGETMELPEALVDDDETICPECTTPADRIT